MVRSAVNVSVVSYVGGLCLCVPSFTTSVDKCRVKSVGILDQMDTVFGKGVFDFGKETDRFQSLLDSGCELGKNVRRFFMKMTCKVYGDEGWDTLTTDSPFTDGPAGAGVVLKKVSRHRRENL